MLSGKDRDRLRALHEVRQQHITQREAGEQLGVSERWVRKLLAPASPTAAGGGAGDYAPAARADLEPAAGGGHSGASGEAGEVEVQRRIKSVCSSAE